MASNQSFEREGGAANGGARSERNDANDEDDAAVVSAVEEFLAAQKHCSRTNIEGSFGVSLPVSPNLLGYDRARTARENAFLRLRKSPARTLGALAAKRLVLLTLLGLLGSDDPKIFEYAVELVEEYHSVLAAVWSAQNMSDKNSHARWMDTSMTSPGQLFGATGGPRTAG